MVDVVDDDEAVRESLAFLLASVGIEARVHASGEAFLAAGGGDAAGVVLLDLRMTGMSGLEVLAQMAPGRGRPPVIFLTGHGDVPVAVTAIKAGAFDFLEKPFNDAKLIEVVRRALESTRAARDGPATDEESRAAALSARERQVMELLLAGKANKAIAAELGIATRTVEVHRARVFEKLGVRSAVELAVRFGSRMASR
jgi:two-component system response regulator DctR